MGRKGRQGLLAAMGLASGIGISLALFIVAGIYAGRWLDRMTGSEPVFTVLGIVAGLAGGIWSLYRRVMEFWKED